MTIESFKFEAANLGFPRIGKKRELKFALEKYWSGLIKRAELLETAKQIRAANWQLQRDKGIDVIPSNDFSFYDHMLDTAIMVGAIPAEYGWKNGAVDIDTYFAMARGASGNNADTCCGGKSTEEVSALEMTKWFDTNYHYLVPELDAKQEFQLTQNLPLEAFNEALSLGIHTRPTLIGPFTFLKLSKTRDGSDPLDLLPKLVVVYKNILKQLSDAGVKWVRIDEPAFVLELSDKEHEHIKYAYEKLGNISPELRIILASYFGTLGQNLEAIIKLPIHGLHIDAVRGISELKDIITQAPSDLRLSLGLIDGRNIWAADLKKLTDIITENINQVKEQGAKGQDRIIEIAPSCSLLHVPIDVNLETDLDDELKSWLAFAEQKLDELKTITNYLNNDGDAAEKILISHSNYNSRINSPRINNPKVTERLAAGEGIDFERVSEFKTRQNLQQGIFNLPLFPTTTIGSFPQTTEVRNARSQHTKGIINDAQYEKFLEDATTECIKWQEEIGLDILVHGEFERNDMVQYFGEQLDGFTFTKHGWVQSYGSRYVRPPIIFGDVSRPLPMTVKWWEYAQKQTAKVMKGMLTGPVTILNWSFVRDDLTREQVCNQIAYAIRDEVTDLETAGAKMIQIDEAALREGLPLKRSEWKHYLDWAVNAFRICSSSVRDETQIHTHMCYSEFNDIMAAIVNMDADVISIETSRSKMELLKAFEEIKYPNEIGPGVYDIHSPNIPTIADMENLLNLARLRLEDRQIWVNPDCGLKTRKWDEVKPALINMVNAAQNLRQSVNSKITENA